LLRQAFYAKTAEAFDAVAAGLDAIVQKCMEENHGIAEFFAAGYCNEYVERVTRPFKANEYKRRQAPLGARRNFVNNN
jgi:hypothetical protein